MSDHTPEAAGVRLPGPTESARPRASGRRRVPVALYALALTAATCVPYLIAGSRRTPLGQFSQTLAFERDFNSYCSYVRQSAEGAWLFRNQFTPEPHRPAFLNLEFLLCGKLAALLGLSAGAALQVQRGIVCMLFVFAVHWVGCVLFKESATRWLVLVLITTGGGFGWLTRLPRVGPLVAELNPVDLYSGWHPFFSLFLQPHFLASQALSLLAQGLFLRGEAASSPRHHLLAGIVASAMGLVRPYDMLHLQVTSVAYFLAMTLMRRRASHRGLWPSLLLAIVPIPVLVYLLWLFRFHPVFLWWGRLGVLPPPPLSGVALGMGLVLIALPLACWRLLSRRSPSCEQVFLALAAFVGVALVYSYPLLSFSFQFATAPMIPAVLFSVAALSRSLPSWQRAWGLRAALAALVATNAATSFVLYEQKLAELGRGRYVIANESLAMFEWLRTHASSGDVVLAGLRTSNRVPRFTPASVVAGYRFSTVRYEERENEVRRFFERGTGEGFRRRLLRRYAVRYVLVGEEERDTGYDASASPWLSEVFRIGASAVYEVKAP